MEEQATEVEGGKFASVLKHMDKIIGSATVVLIFVVTGFYFRTNIMLGEHTSQIKDLDIKVTSINQKLVDIKELPIKSNAEVGYLKQAVDDIKDEQKKMGDRQTKTDDRLDKIYDLLIEMSGKKNK